MINGIVKKTAAVILMLLAALGFLICVAGVITTIAANRPLSNAVVETIASVEGYSTAIDQTTTLLQDHLASVNDDVSQIQNQLNAAEISDSQDIKTRLLQPVNRLSERLDQADTALERGRAGVLEMQTMLRSLRMTALRIINLVTLVFAFIFTLFGAGQVLLFERSWKWFKSIPVRRSPEGSGLAEDSEGIQGAHDMKG